MFLGAIANRICFLTKVDIYDDNDEGDRSACIIGQSAGQWQLTAYSEADDDFDSGTRCSARCLNW